MKIEQTVGKIAIDSYTDSHPRWVHIFINDQTLSQSLTVEDLHDLRYAADRMIAKLEAAK